MMNDLIAALYEHFFNWVTYELLLDMIYENNDYSKLSILHLVTPLISLLVFYLWETLKFKLDCLK